MNSNHRISILAILALLSMPSLSFGQGLPPNPTSGGPIPQSTYTTLPTGTQSSSGGAAALAGNQNAIYVSSTCPTTFVSGSNCYFVNANWKDFYGSNTTISITNTSPVVTVTGAFQGACSSAGVLDCGKLFFATNAGSVIASDNNYPVSAVVITGTINSCTSTSSCTISANASNSCTTTCDVFFGTDDDALWNTISTAFGAAKSCTTVYLPATMSDWTTVNKFNAQSTNCSAAGATQTNVATLTNSASGLVGSGAGTSRIVLTPTFGTNLGGCTGTAIGVSNGCMFSFENPILLHFGITGGGNGQTGTNSATIFGPGSGLYAEDISLSGFATNDQSANNYGSLCNYGSLINFKEDGFGRSGTVVSAFCWVYGNSYFLDNGQRNFYVPGGANTSWTHGAQYGDVGNNGGTFMQCDGTCYQFGDGITYAGLITSQEEQVNGTAYIHDMQFLTGIANVTGLYMPSATSVVWAQNTNFANGSGVNAILMSNAAGKLYDECGNTTTANNSVAGTVYGCTYSPLFGPCLLASAASPLACVNASQGTVAVPSGTTTYTINTTAVTTTNKVIFQFTTDNAGIAGAPSCATPSFTSAVYETARSAQTSFTFALPTNAGIQCITWQLISK